MTVSSATILRRPQLEFKEDAEKPDASGLLFESERRLNTVRNDRRLLARGSRWNWSEVLPSPAASRVYGGCSSARTESVSELGPTRMRQDSRQFAANIYRN